MFVVDKTQKGTLPDAELDGLLEFINSNYWKNAFKELKFKVLRNKENWFCNLKRGEYYNQLPLKRKEKVLDMGAGAGVISQSLSSTFSRVYSLEYNPKWVKFLLRRFQQERVDNVHLLRANALNVPFKKNSFDLIVVNGVLEWVADFSPNGSPEEIQLCFLKDCFDLIGQDGKISIAIENRLYIRWFLGESPHGEPPYVALMPRTIANFFYKNSFNKKYRNYIYSYWGYKKLMKRAGFRNIDIKIAIPNYYDPLFVISFDKGYQIKYFQKSSISKSKNYFFKKLSHFLLYFGLLGYFEHSFYISGDK